MKHRKRERILKGRSVSGLEYFALRISHSKIIQVDQN